MKNCIEVKELLSLYIDGELDKKTSDEVKKHMRFCTECYEEMEDIKRVIQLCRDCEDEELPVGFKKQLHEKLASEAERQHSSAARSRKITRLLGIGSSIAALLIMAVIVKDVWFNQNLTSKSESPEAAILAGSGQTTISNFSEDQKAPNSSPSDKIMDKNKEAANNDSINSNYSLKSFDANKKASSGMQVSRSEDEGLRTVLPAGSYIKSTEAITFKCDKPEDISVKLNEWSFNNNTIAVNTTENNALAAGVTEQNTLSFKVPGSKYNEFKSLLKTSFPNCEISFGTLSKVDVTPQINAENTKINELTSTMSSSYMDSDDAARIKADIESSKTEVSNMKNDSAYVFITINLIKKD